MAVSISEWIITLSVAQHAFAFRGIGLLMTFFRAHIIIDTIDGQDRYLRYLSLPCVITGLNWSRVSARSFKIDKDRPPQLRHHVKSSSLVQNVVYVRAQPYCAHNKVII